MKLSTSAALLCAATAAVSAQEKNAAVELNSHERKLSYLLGHNYGSRIKHDDLKVDVETLVAGLKEALAGKPSRLSDEDAQEVFERLQTEMAARAEEKAAQIGAENAKAGEKFLADNGKRKEVTTTASGLQYEVLKKGDGPKPKASDTVKVHYHGTLIDGTVFDSSIERGEPIEFGVKQVILGWTEALQLMPVGSKWKLFIPSKLAYGEQGAGDVIGPNETLIFEVELLDIKK